MDWFEVSKDGLAKLREGKPKWFILYELLQNAYDEKTNNVSVKIERIGSSPYVRLIVIDDNPEGFVDLTHAFTLFAESAKKVDAEKRGRFNLGEKLVLAMCRKASIRSTKGAVYFEESGRRSSTSNCRNSGTEFVGELRMTNDDIAACEEALHLLIPPEGVTTSFDFGAGVQYLQPLPPEVSFAESLPTEVADSEGVMRRTTRKTKVTIHHAADQAYLYEMGIPVVEIDGRYHVNVHQKVPLNLDRDNVTPAYLAKVHALTVEHMRDSLKVEDVNESWIKIAVQEGGDDLSDDTIRKIADLRFGTHRVAYDPSDPEANNIAVSQGYQVVHGGNLSGVEWGLMRRANAILPAGKVTPSRPDNTVPRITIPRSKWTESMVAIAAFCEAAAPHVIGVKINVSFSNNTTVGEVATYGHRNLDFNVGRLGYGFFSGPLHKIIDLVIHELGHEKSGNHLSADYYDALTEIGAKMTILALTHPALFGPLYAESLLEGAH